MGEMPGLCLPLQVLSPLLPKSQTGSGLVPFFLICSQNHQLAVEMAMAPFDALCKVDR